MSLSCERLPRLYSLINIFASAVASLREMRCCVHQASRTDWSILRSFGGIAISEFCIISLPRIDIFFVRSRLPTASSTCNFSPKYQGFKMKTVTLYLRYVPVFLPTNDRFSCPARPLDGMTIKSTDSQLIWDHLLGSSATRANSMRSSPRRLAVSPGTS